MTNAIAHPALYQQSLEPEILLKEIGHAGDRFARFSRLIGGETAAFATLSVGDLLYDAFRIDPTSIEGIDFARAADLSDIFTFAHFAQDLHGLEAASLAGNVAQLHGYVAERVAAIALLAQGVDVEFPATSNQAGWDLLVNGEPFQVKCLATPAGIHEHFVRYPDIPVIANSELSNYFLGDSRVVTLDSFSHADVVTRTKQTLDAGADLLDLQIPLIACAVAAARAGLAILMRETDPLRAIGAAGIGGVMGTVGGAVGAASTAATMALLGITHGWYLIIAPVFGGIAGFRGGGVAADLLKTHLICRVESESLITCIRSFAKEAAEVLSRMLGNSDRFRNLVLSRTAFTSPFAKAMQQDWIRRVEQEIDHRQYFLQKLLAAAKNSRSIDPTTRDPRRHAASVMWAAAQGGVIQANLRGPTNELQDAVRSYDATLKRWLLR